MSNCKDCRYYQGPVEHLRDCFHPLNTRSSGGVVKRLRSASEINKYGGCKFFDRGEDE